MCLKALTRRIRATIIEILLNWNHLKINIHTRRVRVSTNYYKKGRRGCLATLNLKNGWQVTIMATAQSVNFKVKESENWMTLQKENSKILYPDKYCTMYLVCTVICKLLNYFKNSNHVNSLGAVRIRMLHRTMYLS